MEGEGGEGGPATGLTVDETRRTAERGEMPWKVSSPVEEKVRFVMALERREARVAELCRQQGISREAGYPVMQWYEEEGFGGLAACFKSPCAKVPHRSPQQTTEMWMFLGR